MTGSTESGTTRSMVTPAPSPAPARPARAHARARALRAAPGRPGVRRSSRAAAHRYPSHRLQLVSDGHVPLVTPRRVMPPLRWVAHSALRLPTAERVALAHLAHRHLTADPLADTTAAQHDCDF